jgi:hypothetical protein
VNEMDAMTADARIDIVLSSEKAIREIKVGLG